MPPLIGTTGRYWCRAAHIAATAIPFPEKNWWRSNLTGITTTPLFDYCISPEPEFHMSSVTFQLPELSFLQTWRSRSWSVVTLPSGAV